MEAATPRARPRVVHIVGRAVGEFLGVPLAVVLCFLGLTGVVYGLDAAGWADEGHPDGLGWLGRLLGDTGALSSLLATVASSIITVTSITFSLLLLAVQQGSAALTSQVFDQFLRRRSNQLYFGFFVGLSVYVLLTLVTASALHRPVFGTLVAVLLTAAALCMVVLLIYNTIDQMRSAEIVKAIHHHTLRAREAQMPLLRTTRRAPTPGMPIACTVLAEEDGVVSAIDAGALGKALAACPAGVEVEILVGIGAYVAFRDPLVRIRSSGELDEAVQKRVSEAAIRAIDLDEGRDLSGDPAFGIEQLSTMSWTTVSTAHSNPQPGILACQGLRDILSRWGAEWPPPENPASPVVYPDRVVHDAIAALESLGVVASESIQHQTLAEVTRTLAVLLVGLPRDLKVRLEDVALRSLSALGEHVLTRELEEALRRLEDALRETGFAAGADAVARATAELARTVGRLNSRSTRVPQSG